MMRQERLKVLAQRAKAAGGYGLIDAMLVMGLTVAIMTATLPALRSLLLSGTITQMQISISDLNNFMSLSLENPINCLAAFSANNITFVPQAESAGLNAPLVLPGFTLYPSPAALQNFFIDNLRVTGLSWIVNTPAGQTAAAPSPTSSSVYTPHLSFTPSIYYQYPTTLRLNAVSVVNPNVSLHTDLALNVSVDPTAGNVILKCSLTQNKTTNCNNLGGQMFGNFACAIPYPIVTAQPTSSCTAAFSGASFYQIGLGFWTCNGDNGLWQSSGNP